MRFNVFLALLIFGIAGLADARSRVPDNVGARQNSNTGTFDYCLKITDESGNVVNDKCKPVKVPDGFISDEGDYYLIRSGLANGGGTSMTTNETDVDPSYNYIEKHIASDPAFNAGTLPDGSRGQVLTIQVVEVQGSGTWTLTPDTATGFTSLIFEAVGDLVTLLYVDDTTGWIVISQESVEMT